MAKKKTSKNSDSQINKAALIKEALAQNPDAKPKEIAASIGRGVTAQYVSTVKTSMRTRRKKSVKKKSQRSTESKRSTPRASTTAANLDFAIAFVESVGGLDAAKQQIETIERIKRL